MCYVMLPDSDARGTTIKETLQMVTVIIYSATNIMQELLGISVGIIIVLYIREGT